MEAKKIACFREYEQLRKADTKQQATENPEAEKENKLSFEERKQLNREIKKAEQRVEQAEQFVTEKENEIAVMEEKMAAGVVDDELLRKYGETQKQLEKAMVEWEVATEDLEQMRTKY